MNGGHQAVNDAELVVEDLRDGGEAVGGAGSVGNELLSGISLLVHAAYEHGGVVLGGSGHNDVFSAGLDVGLGFFFGEEETGRLNDVLSAYSAPADFFRVAARGNADFLAVDDQEGLVHVEVNGAVELAVHGVVLEHVSHVVNGEKVVDSNYFDVVALAGCAENEATDTAEAVNTNFSHS